MEVLEEAARWCVWIFQSAPMSSGHRIRSFRNMRGMHLDHCNPHTTRRMIHVNCPRGSELFQHVFSQIRACLRLHGLPLHRTLFVYIHSRMLSLVDSRLMNPIRHTPIRYISSLVPGLLDIYSEDSLIALLTVSLEQLAGSCTRRVLTSWICKL